MNKQILLTGAGLLCVYHLFSQHTLAPSAAQAMALPLSATAPVHKTAGHFIELDETLLRADGTLTGLSSTGDTLFVSEYHKDQLHGDWRSWYPAKTMLDSGRMAKAIPDGEWKGWYPNGQLRFIRTYNASKLQTVNHEIRRRHGKVTYYPITDIAKRDLPAARQLLTAGYSFRSITNETPAQAAPASLRLRVHHNTEAGHKAYLPPFTNCLHHGLYMNFYANGNVKDSGYYKNGIRDGIWEEWQEEGAVRASGMYRKGVKQGDWRHYNASGKLLYIVSYKNGRVKHTMQLNRYS
ncbi:MAG: hypothetical protein P0Y53_24860 [Candidatus Pseudobacter hemicellulosilyticus]|uniref:MORN repeat protein n=1 Tax=Candidatus Pseudobacter hemicellulosilyticus TaxID=3121375 RepID=A0AAJ5WWN6_9BACT|nr:MAG: hypothetical protein P0Y53_24860 [Pseudobacter sp.]